MKAAIQTAKAVVAKADASSEEIVSAYNTLQARINATTEVEEPTKPDAGNSHKTSGSSSSKNNSNVYGSAGTAVVNQAVTAAQNVLAQASVYSDTTVSFSLKRGSAYCFKMTVVNGNGVAPELHRGQWQRAEDAVCGADRKRLLLQSLCRRHTGPEHGRLHDLAGPERRSSIAP